MFSVVIAVFLTVSIQDLRPNTQDTSAFYLEHIYRILADPDAKKITSSTPSISILVRPPPFRPPTYAVWVNSLWFLSMAISLTCALLATMLHQCASRYMRITQPVSCSPHKRARIRAFFADGADQLNLHWAVGALPILLHLSHLSFFAGLLVFLFNVNQTAFTTIVGWATISGGIYASITLMPIFRYDSPYYAPLSSTAWFLYTAILYVIFKVLCLIPRRRGTPDSLRDKKDRYREWALCGVEKAAEDTASERSSKVDGDVLDWTAGALNEDDALERFFEALPGFCDSKEVGTRIHSLLRMKIRQVMDGFLDRTFSSEFISESTKIGRLTICLNASNVALGPFAVSRILSNIFEGRWRHAPQSIDMGHSLRRWCYSSDEWIALNARSIVAGIIAVQERDDRWIALVKDQFGLPRRVLQENILYGDSVLLVILLHVTSNLFHSVFPPWDSNILRVLSRFDIHNTLPHLQRDFCALWNEIVREARNGRPYSTPVFILKEIRHLYAALHGRTRFSSIGVSALSASTSNSDDIIWQPSSYPFCTIISHRSELMSHVHGMTAGQPTPTPVSPVSAEPPLDPSLVPSSVPIQHDVPTLPASNGGLSSQLTSETPSGNPVDEPQQVFVHTSPLSGQSPSPETPVVPATSGNTDTSITPLMVHPSDVAASPRSEATTVVPSPVVSDATAPPDVMPIAMELPSTSESDLHLTLQVASAPEPPVTPSIGTTGSQYNPGFSDSPTPTQTEDNCYPRQPASVDPGNPASTSSHEDSQLDLYQS